MFMDIITGYNCTFTHFQGHILGHDHVKVKTLRAMFILTSTIGMPNMKRINIMVTEISQKMCWVKSINFLNFHIRRMDIWQNKAIQFKHVD